MMKTSCLVCKPQHSSALMVVRNFSSGALPEPVIVSGTPDYLVETDQGEGQQEVELHEVAQGWFEVVIVAKLHRVPSLDSCIKHHSSVSVVVGGVVLLPDKLTLQSIPQDTSSFLQQSLSSGCSASNRHLYYSETQSFNIYIDLDFNK